MQSTEVVSTENNILSCRYDVAVLQGSAITEITKHIDLACKFLLANQTKMREIESRTKSYRCKKNFWERLDWIDNSYKKTKHHSAFLT